MKKCPVVSVFQQIPGNQVILRAKKLILAIHMYFVIVEFAQKSSKKVIHKETKMTFLVN